VLPLERPVGIGKQAPFILRSYNLLCRLNGDVLVLNMELHRVATRL